MPLSLLLAQLFFREQYQKKATSVLQLWKYYGSKSLSGCQLWSEYPASWKDHQLLDNSLSTLDSIDWSKFVQDYRKDSMYQQYFAQFFSPFSAIEYILEEIGIDHDNFLDPSCGAGCFLVRVWEQLEANGEPCKTIASKLYGVDLDSDLVALTRFRLFQRSNWSSKIGEILQKNILYSFMYMVNLGVKPS